MNTADPTVDPWLRTGMLVCLAYAVAQVVLNGIVLDETVIAAQIIVGDVAYPAGHPHGVYYPSAFSLPHYLSALSLWLYPSVEATSALRNVLFMFVPMFGAFALTTVLTRRPLWGALAVIFVIADANVRLAGVYPMWAFPNIYSNGHIGLHLSVLILALLLAGWWKSGAFLLGLLPAIHGSFALIVWPWALLFLIGTGVYRDRFTAKRVALWGGLGAAGCAAVFGLIAFMTGSPVPASPYTTTGDPTLIRERFLEWSDVHRREVLLGSFPYLVNLVGFIALGSALWFRRSWLEQSTKLFWVFMLGAAAWGYVLLAQGLAGAGIDLPSLVVTSMPGRFSNIPAALLLPLSAVVLAHVSDGLDDPKRGAWTGLLAVLLLGFALAAGPWLDGMTRSVMTRNMLFLMWGVALGGFALLERGRIPAALGMIALLGAMLGSGEESWVWVYMLVAGAGTLVALSRPLERIAAHLGLGTESVAARTWLPAMALFALLLIPGRSVDPIWPDHVRWDMQSEDTRALKSWFADNAEPDEMVLAGFMPRTELQVKTGQPVLFEAKTLWMMSYMPDLAPVLNEMVSDLYGVDYTDEASLRNACEGGVVGPFCQVWQQTLVERPAARWSDLSEKWGFRLVLVASELTLDLPVALPGSQWTLYAIDNPGSTHIARNSDVAEASRE